MLKTRFLSRKLNLLSIDPTYICPVCRTHLSTSTRRSNDAPFRARLRTALKDTRVQWRTIPVGLGIASVGALQFYRVQTREKKRQGEEDVGAEARENQDEYTPRPKKRQRIRPSGPWYYRDFVFVANRADL